MTRKRTPYLSDLINMIDSENPQTIEVHGKTYTQVIRCKDCKYHTGRWCTKYSTKQFDINDICKDDNDYCSCAERKEE